MQLQLAGACRNCPMGQLSGLEHEGDSASSLTRPAESANDDMLDMMRRGGFPRAHRGAFLSLDQWGL